MCGIIGSVGKSTNKDLSFTLMTHLLRETQRRGPHSTGHFGVDANNSQTFAFKSPVPAKIYTNLMEWKCVQNIEQKALIGHARFKTKGGIYNNSNNHPHISPSGNIALVHNGTIYKFEKHKKDYTLNGESDSELLLKIIVDTRNVLNGIKKIYEMFGDSGDFACEVIYRDPTDGKTRFFFFRDSGRPGRFVDARNELGQYFFFSENSIWKDAIRKACEERKDLKDLDLDKLPVIIIPSFQIWEIDAQTLEISKHSIDVPVKREIKPKREKKKMALTVSAWVKEKRNNVTTSIPKYEPVTTVYSYGSGGVVTGVSDSYKYRSDTVVGTTDAHKRHGRFSEDYAKGHNYAKEHRDFFHE